jgi:hypothetical protein
MPIALEEFLKCKQQYMAWESKVKPVRKGLGLRAKHSPPDEGPGP